MATLRDLLGGVNTDDGTANLRAEQDVANGMGDLSRGWASGRIGNELNPLQTEALDAEIAGDQPQVETLRGRIDALKQRQGIYAPRVGRVEDINGIGDGLDWAQSQVGQGVASMLDPMAVSAGLGTVGRIASRLPGPGKFVGGAAQLAGLAIPAMMSKEQLTGEFIGTAQEDPELMARTSPQALRDMGGNYGAVAAIPDSFLPGMVGRQLSGLTRAGSAAARQATMGAGAKTLLGMGVEGATETAQSMGSQYAQGVLNPDRDTSGDFMENVNSFAGGAVGAGPFSAAGAMAEAGHNRLDGGIEYLGEKAGDMVDLANNSELGQKAKSAGSKVRGAVTDLLSDEDGKVSAAALVENLKAGASELKSRAQTTADEHSVLSGLPPEELLTDDTKLATWLTENDPKRAQLVADKLSDMEEPEAQAHLEAIQNPDPAAQQTALDDAARYVLENSTMGRAKTRMDALGDALGKGAAVAGPAIGKGAVAAGKAVLDFGKAVLGGAKDGMAKKNEQSDAPEGFMAWRDRYYGVTGQALADKAVADADPVQTQRAELAGNYAGDMAARLNPKAPNAALLARHAAYIMSDVAMQTNAKGMGAQNVRLNRLVDDLHGAFRAETPEVLQQLGSIMGPKGAGIVKYMSEELAQRLSPNGVIRAAKLRDELARQAVGLVDPAAQNALMQQGVNLNTPKGREDLLNLMEDYADGIGSANGARAALDRTFGPESVQNILTLLNGQPEKEKVGTLVDDRKQARRDFDGEADEKEVTKGSGPKVYGFHATKNLRANDERKDMFGAMEKLTKDQEAERVAVGDVAVRRPALFKKGQKLHDGSDAVEKKIADIQAQLVEDPEYPDHDNYDVRAKPAREVMKDSGMQPGKVLQLYRDYLRMDANDDSLSAEERSGLKAQADAAHYEIIRSLRGDEGAGKMSIAMRKARRDQMADYLDGNPEGSVEEFNQMAQRDLHKAADKYFNERFVVVGEQLSNRDPSKIAITELMALDREGKGLISRAKIAEEPMQALSDANVLMFKTKGGEVAVPAGKLVNWVRQQRGKSEANSAEDNGGDMSNRTKDDDYLADVSEGIATLIGSGHVQGMPYKFNKFGKIEHFKQGVPDSLRLATKTYGDMKFATKSRREKRKARTDAELATVGTAEYDAEVAADQNKNDEFFTADDRAERDLVVDSRRTKPRRQMTEQRASDQGSQLSTRGDNEYGARDQSLMQDERWQGPVRPGPFQDSRNEATKLRADRSGEVVADPKTDDPGKTPLDFSKAQRDGVPDEHANQRWLSQQTGATTDAVPGPEPKGTAASSAKFRAAKIGEAFLNDPAKGQEMIRSRIRSAMRPEYSEDKTQVVGGVHYIAPVAAFINATELANANVDLPAATINAIQAKVANILLKGQVSLTEKVKIARLMLDGVEKITAMNVDAVLGRYAQSVTKGKPIVAKTEAAPEVAKAGLPKGQPTLSGASSGRKLNAMAVDIHTDLQRGGFAATHDSPIRHEGKFDWRSHLLSGEGAAVMGAGTYLSTSDGVHRNYKDQFTATAREESLGALIGAEYFIDPERVVTAAYKAEVLTKVDKVIADLKRKLADPDTDPREADGLDVNLDWTENLRREVDALPLGKAPADASTRSPTYEVSVNISPEELMDWDAPIGEQSELVQKAARSAVAEFWPTSSEESIGRITGRLLYVKLGSKLGGDTAVSNYLQALGVLGHSYAADAGRNRTYPNYVIYDDAKITTNYVHFNQQAGPSKVSTQAERDAATAYATKVLGPKVQVLFKDILGYSGEFIEAQNVIEISTTAAAGTLGTLYHEAMHKFFADFVRGNPGVQAVFESLINDPKHLAKLNALLTGFPAAQAQLVSGEERLAYTYQFWKAGLLDVDAKAATWLQKVGKFFRQVLGMVRDTERALELFEAFDNGKMSEPSAAGQVILKAMNRGTNALKVRRRMDGLLQGLAALTYPSAEILGRSVSPTARKLNTMFFTNPGEEEHAKEEPGLINARKTEAQRYINTVNRRLEDMSDRDQMVVQKYLQQETDLADIPLPDHRDAVKEVRQVLERFHKYMTDSGMKIGKIDKYYPTVWSTRQLFEKKAEFIAMLTTKYAAELKSKKPAEAAERIWQSLVNKEGVDAHLPAEREDGVLAPFFASQEMRTLPWLKGEDKEMFLEKDMALTLTRYFSQGAHATEYFRRFGENGTKLDDMLYGTKVKDPQTKKISHQADGIIHELHTASREMMKRGAIKDEAARKKWVGRQMRDVVQATGAMEGSLGKDVSPNMRKFNSWMAVYQNIRLLPMALFSSFVDPLALVARGAPMKAAFDTFTYSMREVFRGWADAFSDMPADRQKDEWRKLSEAVGASEIAMFSHHVSEEYSSGYMTPGAKRLNDKMFVFNGMEAWNRGSRIMATKWAVRFIEQHAALPDKTHSARWLAELGLTPATVTKNSEGDLITDRHELAAEKGITLEEATKEIAAIHHAINRWVEGAVLTPNAAQRPSWSSDPNFASMFHLKQFSYSFHQTILKRATNEFDHGNMAPLGALAMFIPTMIGADIMKGLIQGAGTLPPYMQGMNAGDWFMHGVQRAGLAGIGAIGTDAATDWASLGGPAFEQIVDASRDGFGSASALKAMPVNSLYTHLVS